MPLVWSADGAGKMEMEIDVFQDIVKDWGETGKRHSNSFVVTQNMDVHFHLNQIHCHYM